MNIFLTGGTGFIGNHFIKCALEKGHNIFALTRGRTIPNCNPHQNLHWLKKEIDEVSFDDFQDIDVMVHLASYGVSPQPANWQDCFDFNVIKSVELVRKAIFSGVKRFVITGSCYEYGTAALNYDFIPTDAPLFPTDIYSASKAASFIAFNTLTMIESVEIIYLRLSSVYGEGQHKDNFWSSLKKAAVNGEDFYMTKGEQIRDFISVSDVAIYLEKCCLRNDTKIGHMLVENLASGEPITLKEFSEFWWKKWKASGKIHYGAIKYRKNEVMKYLPKINKA